MITVQINRRVQRQSDERSDIPAMTNMEQDTYL